LVGAGIIKPLLFDEILTISLYGTLDELSELEGHLAKEEELQDIHNVQTSILELSKRVKDRLKIGLKISCCPSCKHFENCVKKWLRAERDIESKCCFRCSDYVDCAEKCKRKQLKQVVHNENVSSAPENSSFQHHIEFKVY